MTRMLFVDDEPSMLRVLKLALRSMAGEWDMEFVNSGKEALALIEQRAYDVVVTDMRMPDFNGAQLLNQVLRRHPHTIRIILSGYSDLSEVVDCVGLTHQFLEKPCSLEDLKNCLKRVTQMKARLSNDQLCLLAASLTHLPSLPSLYLEITEALQSPTSSSQRIADIASKDPAISAKLLQLSNSAFFGFSHKVFSVDEAVQLIGVNVIQSLAMAVPIFSAFSRSKCPGFPIDQIWEHSVQTALIARRLATTYLDDPFLGEQAFCAGMLHDLGKLILADGLAQVYGGILQEARTRQTPLCHLERLHLQATHAEVGGYVLALWGLPMPLVEAVANHHQPGRSGTQEPSLAGLIHVASALHQPVPPSPFAPSPLDLDFVRQVGWESQLPAWREEFAGNGTQPQPAA